MGKVKSDDRSPIGLEKANFAITFCGNFQAILAFPLPFESSWSIECKGDAVAGTLLGRRSGSRPTDQFIALAVDAGNRVWSGDGDFRTVGIEVGSRLRISVQL